MKLLNFSTEDDVAVRLGILTEDGVIDVVQVAEAHSLHAPTTMQTAIEQGSEGLAAVIEAADAYLSEDEIIFAPCLLNPEKIICVGLNYRRHAQEAGLAVPDTPVLFSKFNNSLAAHGEDILMVSASKQYDYEAELGAVIGREARNVIEARALDYVFGYCTINDVSARDLQMRTSQWLLGKTMDKALPIGPYLVTAEAVTDPHNLQLTSHVNGELRQNSNTSDLIFNLNQVISYISQMMTLRPGDIISTGTPEGVALGMDPPPWLQAGDEVTIEVEGLGRLRNRFVSEA